MRFMIMHRTDAQTEAGAMPSPEFIARVGQLVGDLVKTGVLRDGEGLRPSSQGVRLQFAGGRRTVTRGPFSAAKAVPAGFAILRLASLDEAIGWVSRFAEMIGDVDIDIRPVTEEWDLGMAPKPEGLTTTRYMAVHCHDAAERGAPPTPELMAKMGRLIEEMSQAGVLLATEGLQPSAKGARIVSAGGKHTVIDGPFAESKELIGGYVIVDVPSLDDAKDLALRYADAMGNIEMDIRALS
ncbi:YciI family protein [Polyangium sp. 15x6]|uniref:YciI family protein n=1 Tax=Polyangium sp. 15x6 TaxID=3042687 RepID=UPI00249AB367|nr:YciI family protein [Polyangium sp. 15x6]MDI3290685.1 YciI family protein [Polyangium sp. 15x6]